MKLRAFSLTVSLVTVAMLSGCFRDVDNGYRIPRHTAQGAVAGAVTGLAYSSAATATGAGTAGVAALVGGAVGGSAGYLGSSRTGEILRLVTSGVQVIQYGDQTILVIPSDILFEPTTSDIRYETFSTLMDATALIQSLKGSEVVVQAFADNVGNMERSEKLTQRQAQSVLSFFWSHGVTNHRMRAIGYGHGLSVASNLTSQGSGYNRRVEVHIRPARV